MKVRRDIASIPLHSAEDTWSEFKALVTGNGSVEVEQLDNARSVMESLITDEAFKREPLTLAGVGNRLVVYFVYGHDALEAGNDVDKLTWNPTAGNWTLYVPCPLDQYDWAKKVLATRAPRFVVLKPGEKPKDEETSKAAANVLEVNWEALGR